MSISFNGFNTKNVTFECEDAIDAGTPVKTTSNGCVVACSANDSFIGINVCSRNYLTTVQLTGYVECSYSGSAPSLGFEQLAADSAGGVKAVTGDVGNVYKVLYVNTTDKIVGFII